MNKLETKTYFDTRVYKESTDESIRQDLAALVIENADVSVEQRITPYELNFNSKGEVTFRLRWETEVDRLENQALYMIRDLAKEGRKNLIWISPPSIDVGYNESRMVVSVLKEKSDDGSLFFECRGLCFKFGTKKCLEIGRKFSGYDFFNGEVLRGTAIPFELEENDKDWVDTLERKIVAPEVWRAIREGSDFLNKKKTEEIAEEVLVEFGSRLRTDMSYRESLQLGWEIEQFYSSRGVNLQRVGSCGISNTEALKGSFDVVFASSINPDTKPEGYNYYCPICHCWCKGETCDICKIKLSKAA